MSNQKKKDISLKEEISTCCQPENNKNQVPILLQTEAPLVSSCSCSQPLANSKNGNKRVEFTVLQTSSVKIQPEIPFTITNSSSSSCCSDDAGSCEILDQNLNDIQELAGNILEYLIEGMDCPVCAQTIEKSLSKLPGISNVKVNYSTSKMQVVVEDNSYLAGIQTHVQKLGFQARPIAQNKEKGQTFIIEGMDCGVCAQSLEKYLNTLPAVREVSVNFSTGKMHIVHDMTLEEVIKAVSKSGFKATLVSRAKNTLEAPLPAKNFTISLSTISGIFLALGFLSSKIPVIPELISILLYGASIIIGVYRPAKSAYYAIKSKSLDMNVLMTTAALGAALIGQWLEAAAVVWLFSLGTTLQTKAVDKTRASIRDLMNLAPPEAWLKIGDDLIRTSVEDISVGDTVVIKPGERVPLDGEIIFGTSSINQAPITGESIPVDKDVGNPVYAGTINENGSIQVRITKLVEDTTIAKIIHLVEEAQEKKAPTQAIVDRFAKIYTPIVFILAILTMVIPPLLDLGTWSSWFYKSLELLIIACPCALSCCHCFSHWQRC